MYNGQYTKGIVHLIVFAILASLTSEGHDMFLLFVFGWVFYQVFEAYHTAQARRDGTPLPNPFGLNDLGERLGFGKAWPSATPPTSDVPPAAGPPPPTAQGAPPYSYTYNYSYPPVPPIANLDDLEEDFIHPPNRFPAGAIWLIGLGLFFLLANLHVFGPFPAHHLVPFFLIGLGVWLFVRRMTSPVPLLPDAAADHRLRIFHALRGSIWIILVGVLFLLDTEHILRWGRSWPLFIITAGVMQMLKRAAYATSSCPYEAPAPPASPGTAIVPTHTDSHEEN